MEEEQAEGGGWGKRREREGRIRGGEGGSRGAGMLYVCQEIIPSNYNAYVFAHGCREGWYGNGKGNGMEGMFITY